MPPAASSRARPGRRGEPRSGFLGARALLAGAFVLASGLQLLAIHSQSLIGDAPFHLLAGDQALRDGLNVVNLEHPPLVKMVAALPLLLEDRLAPRADVDRAVPAALGLFDQPEKANRIRIRSRLALFVAFAIPLVAACRLLGSELAGPRAGAVLALTVALSFNVLPFLSVLQSDAAVSLGFVLTAWTSIRYVRRPTGGRALGLGLALGLALATKFSGVLLAPLVPLSVLLARPYRRRHLAHAAVMVLVSTGFLWGTYAAANRNYDPESGRRALRLYCGERDALGVDGRLAPWQETLLSVETRSPELAQWLVGFLGIRSRNAVGVFPAYAFGEISYEGRWWYFPAVLLVKTPLAILIATVLASTVRRSAARPLGRDALVVVGTVTALYLGTAVVSSYNLGMRHLLPILPFVYLPAALWASRTARRTAVLVGVLAAEAVLVAPLWMSATNTWWLGPANPTRTALSHSNFEAHQNFIALRRHAESRKLEPFYVVQPGIRPQELATYFPRAALLGAGDEIVPGWYAVNATVEQFIPAISKASRGALRHDATWRRLVDEWSPVWREIRAAEDHGWVAGTYHLYRVGTGTAAPAP